MTDTSTILQPNSFLHVVPDDSEVMLDINNLTKIYPTPKGEYIVLENLNLQVKKEEFVSIIGHS